jgi:hypothetical protein
MILSHLIHPLSNELPSTEENNDPKSQVEPYNGGSMYSNYSNRIGYQVTRIITNKHGVNSVQALSSNIKCINCVWDGTMFPQKHTDSILLIKTFFSEIWKTDFYHEGIFPFYSSHSDNSIDYFAQETDALYYKYYTNDTKLFTYITIPFRNGIDAEFIIPCSDISYQDIVDILEKPTMHQSTSHVIGKLIVPDMGGFQRLAINFMDDPLFQSAIEPISQSIQTKLGNLELRVDSYISIGTIGEIISAFDYNHEFIIDRPFWFRILSENEDILFVLYFNG